MKRFFSIYTKRQRIGLYILCVVVVLSIGFNIIIRFHTRHKLQQEMYQDSLFQQEVFLFFNEEIAKPKNTKQKQFLTKKNQQKGNCSNKKKNKPSLSKRQEEIQNNLSNHFSSPVELSCTKNGKGKISISFTSNNDLERIVQLLNK